MSFKPSQEQQDIISFNGSCVIIAGPGSGKTFTLSQKIKSILEELPEYRGVIAISFTNKASLELESRVRNLGVDSKSSFFGTIDSFYLSEIVAPFLRHKYDFIPDELIVEKYSDDPLKSEECKNWQSVRCNYERGTVFLESLGWTAIELLKSNRILREYLCARYSHVFIDEYQDSGREQHGVFCILQKLGLVAVAVGDLDQSIYEFAGKSSLYLSKLKDDSSFKTFLLTENRRCHESIDLYAKKFLNQDLEITELKDKRVIRIDVSGGPVEVSLIVEKIVEKLVVQRKKCPSDIGILVADKYTADFFLETLSTFKVQYYRETGLAKVRSERSLFFERCLTCFFDYKESLLSVVERYDEKLLFAKFKKVSFLEKVCSIKDFYHKNASETFPSKDVFVCITSLASQLGLKKDRADDELHKVLEDSRLRESYYPRQDDYLQLMTLHKSKGLEFEVVFHLDLVDYKVPSHGAIHRNGNELVQSRNLHYVGLTRAKEYCFLLSSTRRVNAQGKEHRATPSRFLDGPGLDSLRDTCKLTR